MEPRKDEKTIEARKEERTRRFRIVKLEERIAPSNKHCTRARCPFDCEYGTTCF